MSRQEENNFEININSKIINSSDLSSSKKSKKNNSAPNVRPCQKYDFFTSYGPFETSKSSIVNKSNSSSLSNNLHQLILKNKDNSNESLSENLLNDINNDNANSNENNKIDNEPNHPKIIIPKSIKNNSIENIPLDNSDKNIISNISNNIQLKQNMKNISNLSDEKMKKSELEKRKKIILRKIYQLKLLLTEIEKEELKLNQRIKIMKENEKKEDIKEDKNKEKEDEEQSSEDNQ